MFENIEFAFSIYYLGAMTSVFKCLQIKDHIEVKHLKKVY